MRQSRARRSRSSGRSAISRGHGVRHRQRYGGQVSPSCSVTGAQGIRGISVFRQDTSRTVSVDAITRRQILCSVIPEIRTREVDAMASTAPAGMTSVPSIDAHPSLLRLFCSSLQQGKPTTFGKLGLPLRGTEYSTPSNTIRSPWCGLFPLKTRALSPGVAYSCFRQPFCRDG